MAYTENTREMAAMVATLNPLINKADELEPVQLKVAFDLETATLRNEFGKTLRSPLVRLIAVSLLGYILEVKSGNGLWQVFLRKHHELYGRWLPFGFDAEDGYEPGKPNRADVRWIIWYVIAGSCQRQRYIYPLSPKVDALADALWQVVKDADNNGISILTTAEMREVGPAQICELLYWRHWLLQPAFDMDRQTRVAPVRQQIESTAQNAEQRDEMMREMRHDIMATLPTGPLALGISDWVAPLLGMRRKQSGKSAEKPEHKYYTQFMKATGGKNPIYIEGYESLNRFLSEDMEWGNDEHFPAMRNHHDFTLYADRENGMLICKDVARCIADPDNELYDAGYAAGHAFELLSERGKCAPDLLKLSLNKGWLPNTMFPTGSADESNSELTTANADMLARFYLQQYYTGD